MKTTQAPAQSSPKGKPEPGHKRKGRRKPAPQRTCVGCRTVSSKRTMVRVVRMPDGRVEIDPSGKQSGRGAYLCQKKSCWETALKRRSLDHALKVALDNDTNIALKTYAQALPEDLEPVSEISAAEHQ